MKDLFPVPAKPQPQQGPPPTTEKPDEDEFVAPDPKRKRGRPKLHIDPEDYERPEPTIGDPVATDEKIKDIAFSPSELKRMGDRRKFYTEECGNDRRATWRIEEAVRLEILIERSLAELADKTSKPDVIESAGKRYKELSRQLKVVSDQLGLIPKDGLRSGAREECFSNLWTRYSDEVQARKRRGDKVGAISKEAAELCKREGLDPGKYRREDVMSEKDRDEVIFEARKEPLDG
jgi:hypothetical protein